MTDADGNLQSDPFSFTVRNDRVHISRGGQIVTTLGARGSARFLDRAERTDEPGQQQLMARATGNYKRGNERDRTKRARR